MPQKKDLHVLKEAFNRSHVDVLLKIPRAENNRLERAAGKSRCSVYLSEAAGFL